MKFPKKAANTPGISPCSLSVIATAADNNKVAKKGPPMTYLSDTDNLFKKSKKVKHKWKEKAWVTDIQDEHVFVGVVCARYLFMHIIVKTRYFYEGTNHEVDWLFCHGALSLVTAKDCIAWTKKR